SPSAITWELACSRSSFGWVCRSTAAVSRPRFPERAAVALRASSWLDNVLQLYRHCTLKVYAFLSVLIEQMSNLLQNFSYFQCVSQCQVRALTFLFNLVQ